MSFVPQFRLYASDGTTLVYTFQYVQNINDWQDPVNFVEHDSLRGQGSIMVPGSDSAYDMTLRFMLRGTDYEDLTAQIASLKTTITNFTHFILKVDKTISTTEDYKVLRVQSFVLPIPDTNKRVTFQRVEMTLRVNAWA